MAALRSRRLDVVLGAPVDQLTAHHIDALIDNGVHEDFDLDFKRETYGNSEGAKRDLAADVAALANSAGGVIIVGLDEDSQGVAKRADEPVDFSDKEINRLFQTVASNCAPLVPLDIRAIKPDPTATAGTDAQERGYILIAVPRSASAPHAVVVNNALRFPRRHGRTTHYLSEAEVATAYRARFDSRSDRANHATDIQEELAGRLSPAAGPWLLVSLVPDLPGDLQIDSATFRRFEAEFLNRPVTQPQFYGRTFQRTRVGRRRLCADASLRDGADLTRAVVELHSDGSGVFAFELYDESQRSSEWQRVGADGESVDDGATSTHLIADVQLALTVFSAVATLAEHATTRSYAGGNATFHARLVAASPERSIAICRRTDWGADSLSRMPSVASSAPAEAVVDLGALDRLGPGTVQASSMLLNEIGNTYAVEQLGQFSDTGAVRRRYWPASMWKQIGEWFAAKGIPVSEDRISG
ncbi:RNA-binding domain-containing protein [Micromonospora sp. HUAS YX12]|uniref:RNA-binding domain-containing protein n=1 Tax=Micromonospora sp. HUAS YX12 TaxID=3156396 RepID=A0AAU7QUC6_9ACTN